VVGKGCSWKEESQLQRRLACDVGDAGETHEAAATDRLNRTKSGQERCGCPFVVVSWILESVTLMKGA
jgi:hypothetical protein